MTANLGLAFSLGITIGAVAGFASAYYYTHKQFAAIRMLDTNETIESQRALEEAQETARLLRESIDTLMESRANDPFASAEPGKTNNIITEFEDYDPSKDPNVNTFAPLTGIQLVDADTYDNHANVSYDIDVALTWFAGNGVLYSQEQDEVVDVDILGGHEKVLSKNHHLIYVINTELGAGYCVDWNSGSYEV